MLSRRKFLHGFTLIELLVVIAIISLLVSILLPSLRKAKDLARAAVCMSNQHQCGLGLSLYTAENRLNLALARRDVGGNFRLWLYFHVLGYDAMDNPDQPVALSPQNVLCPATATYPTAIEGGYGVTDSGQSGGYAMYWVDSVRSPMAVREAGLQSDVYLPNGTRFTYQKLLNLPYAPSSMIWLADGILDPNFYTPLPSKMSPAFTDNNWGPYKGGLMQLLHPNETANALFYDGHVTAITGDSGAEDYPIPYLRYFDRNNILVQY